MNFPALNVLLGAIHEQIKLHRRSAWWRSCRNQFLRNFPKCEGCGATRFLQVHHKLPFHDFPHLELVETNLVTLCTGRRDCHRRIGHGGSYRYYNPNVERDLKFLRAHPNLRSEIEILAHQCRQR